MTQRFYQKASVQVAIVTTIGVIIATGITVGYQRSELRLDNKNFQTRLADLQSALADAKAERDKYQMQLAPFLTVANRSFPETPFDQRLDLLLTKIDKIFTEAIRYHLPPETAEGSAALFTTVRFFLDDLQPHGSDIRWHYRRLAVSATKGLATSVTPLLRASTFQNFLKSVGVKVEIMSLAVAD